MRQNKIIIISEFFDKTTDLVVEWLDFFKLKYERYNEDKTLNFNLDINSKGVFFNFKNDIFWIRRGKFNFIPYEIRKTPFYNHFKTEEFPIIESVEEHLNNKNLLLGSFCHEIKNNKIKNLIIARKCGLKVPETIITNRRDELINFFQVNKKIITKCLYKSVVISIDEERFAGNGTILVRQDDIFSLDDLFSPSLFQKYIEKKYEIRVFFFKQNFYSMAIFSQKDEKTKVDYRKYNRVKPNRNVPFNLPLKIKRKLIRFNKLLNIDTGSIDLIVTPENEYFFLEINPQGQLDWLSSNCNYYIEKEIAEYFYKKSNENKKVFIKEIIN